VRNYAGFSHNKTKYFIVSRLLQRQRSQQSDDKYVSNVTLVYVDQCQWHPYAVVPLSLNRVTPPLDLVNPFKVPLCILTVIYHFEFNLGPLSPTFFETQSISIESRTINDDLQLDDHFCQRGEVFGYERRTHNIRIMSQLTPCY